MVARAEPMTSTRTLSRRGAAAAGVLFTEAPSDFDDEVAQVVDDADVGRQQESGGVHLLDDGGTDDAVADVEEAAVVDGAGDVVARCSEVNVAGADHGLFGTASLGSGPADICAGDGGDGLDPERHRFDD